VKAQKGVLEMQRKQAIQWMVLVPLALLLAVTGIGTADEPLAIQPSAISCGDSATCSTAGPSVKVQNSGAGTAFVGQHTWAGIGVEGKSNRGVGVKGSSNRAAGVKGWSWAGNGVAGISENGYGVNAYSANSHAVHAVGPGDSYGVYGSGMVGVRGEAVSLGAGVWGQGNILSYGVVAYNDQNVALWATNGGGIGNAGNFDGDVEINGTLSKSGGSFKIDHPLDPANQYLYHSFVESPDMMNVYNGNVVLDENGEAWVELPDYFEALNRDYRYQLTAIGAPGPNLYIAEEIADNRFKVAGGQPGSKVSWQVTGIRQDPWANANRIPVEEEKPEKERGYYLFPELYGQPESMRVRPIPELQY
jgi:hypothetical protein